MTGQELRKRVDFLIKERGIRYADLAKQLGITHPTLCSAFKVADVRTGFVEQLARILKMHPAELLYGSTLPNAERMLNDALAENAILKKHNSDLIDILAESLKAKTKHTPNTITA